MHWLYLGAAVVFETLGTTALQASQQFTRPLPTLLMAISYAAAFYLLSHTLRVLPVGIMYALWSGIGICMISVLAWVVFGQRLDLPALIGIALIVAGIAVINLFSTSGTY